MHDDASVCSLFASFGLRVQSLERYGPYKERIFYRANGKRVRVRYGRRFAFLDVCPLNGKGDEDDEAGDDGVGNVGEVGETVNEGKHRDVSFWNTVQKAVRSLNGTTWKGATLKCQVAKERGDERVRRENAEEEAARAEEEAMSIVPPEPAVHEKEKVNGENKVLFDDDDDEDQEVGWDRDRDREGLWAEIETPRQWVYNYERHLREVAAAQPARTASRMKPGEEGEGLPEGDEREGARHKSLVEQFLEQQDVARAKRREERVQKEKESFGTVYDGTREDVGKRKRKQQERELGNDKEEERIAVVDFWSDEEEDETVDRGANGRAVDLSRFDDSDSDEAVAMEADGRGSGSGGVDDSEDGGSRERNDDDSSEDGDMDDAGAVDDGTGGSDDGDGDSDDDETSRGTSEEDAHDEENDEEDPEDDEDEEEEDDHHATVANVFPNAATFHAAVPREQAQATLNAQADRIRTSLKTYRKKARRLQKSQP